MNDSPTSHESGSAETEVIREVCQQNQTEPEAIWDALEAKGVETTPGVIYQAMHTPAPTAQGTTIASSIQDCAPGLSAEDLALLGTLAVKAGGVEQLLRILTLWQGTSK